MKDKQKETAVALKYEADEDIAPRIIAKGQGVTAENIVKSAKEHDIPVYQDEKLANQLHSMEIDDYIPEELYEAIAQILVFIAKVDGRELK